jgi:hypothetical protein
MVGAQWLRPASSATDEELEVNMADALPLRAFYSYSHKDEFLRDSLESHLSLLKRQGVISEWHDRRLVPGTDWAGGISKELESADIILLLVSADFLASDYCYEAEMMKAMQRHESGNSIVLPIILRPCDWSGAPFGRLQGLPKDAKPITTWDDRDEALTDVARGIRKAVEAQRASKHKQQEDFPAVSTHPVSRATEPSSLTLGEMLALRDIDVEYAVAIQRPANNLIGAANVVLDGLIETGGQVRGLQVVALTQGIFRQQLKYVGENILRSRIAKLPLLVGIVVDGILDDQIRQEVNGLVQFTGQTDSFVEIRLYDLQDLRKKYGIEDSGH